MVESTSPGGMSPTRGDAPTAASGAPQRELGLAARIEAASRGRAPQPKGKGTVMVLLGVAVIAAVVYEIAFRESARGAAGEPAAETPPAAVTPVPRPGPGETPEVPPTDVPDPEPVEVPVGEPVDVPEGLPGSLSLELGVVLSRTGSADPEERSAALRRLPALLARVPADRIREVRGAVLEHLAGVAKASQAAHADVFEAVATMLARGEAVSSAVRRLFLRAQLALEDDDRAAAALALLGRAEDEAFPSDTVRELIRNAARPLTVRLAAAHALPAAFRSDLAADETLPPILRDALAR